MSSLYITLFTLLVFHKVSRTLFSNLKRKKLLQRCVCVWERVCVCVCECVYVCVCVYQTKVTVNKSNFIELYFAFFVWSKRSPKVNDSNVLYFLKKLYKCLGQVSGYIPYITPERLGAKQLKVVSFYFCPLGYHQPLNEFSILRMFHIVLGWRLAI